MGYVGLWAYNQDLVVSFVSSSISEWTLSLNTWYNTEDAEEAWRRRAKTELAKSQSPKRIVKSERDIGSMAIDAPNLDEVGK